MELVVKERERVGAWQVRGVKIDCEEMQSGNSFSYLKICIE